MTTCRLYIYCSGSSAPNGRLCICYLGRSATSPRVYEVAPCVHLALSPFCVLFSSSALYVCAHAHACVRVAAEQKSEETGGAISFSRCIQMWRPLLSLSVQLKCHADSNTCMYVHTKTSITQVCPSSINTGKQLRVLVSFQQQ